MDTLDLLIDFLAAKHSATEAAEMVEKTCAQTRQTCEGLFDAISHRVAHEYFEGHLSFEIADVALNSLVSVAYDAPGGALPEYSWKVYKAFDAGEYFHPDDSPLIDPEVEYTKALITEIVVSDR